MSGQLHLDLPTTHEGHLADLDREATRIVGREVWQLRITTNQDPEEVTE